MRNKNIFIRVILAVFSSVLLQYGYAQPNIPNVTADYTVNLFSGGPASIGVVDPSFSDIAGGTADFRDKSADMLVSLFIDPNANICYEGHVKVSVDLEVQYRTVNPFGTPSSVITEYITLEVEKSPLLITSRDLERSFRVYKDAYQCDVNILAVTAEDENGNSIATGDIPDDIRVEVELQRTRYFNIPSSPPAQVTSFMMPNPLEQADRYNRDNVVVVRWNTLPWAAEYELEWVFVEDFGTDLGTPILPAALPVQFKNNSSRVRVPASQNTFHIPIVYTNGFVVARVRGVTRGGPALEDDLFGPWSFDPANSGTLTVNDAPLGSKLRIGFGNSYLLNHINAQYTVSFSEDGKILPKGTYADGSLRVRQENVAAAVANTDVNDYLKMGVVTETIYDFLGRPAISTLPAVTERGFSYKVNYNQDLSGAKYSYLNFDFENPASGLCYGASQGMGDDRGAGQYYSDNNPVMDSPQGRLPDAFDFPFTRIIYEADNASRPKIQSGVGLEHRIGNGHETQYVYGNPSQTDLNRLFGTDAGYAGYYQKSMIRDANGQVSITYTDLAGKTIATSLAGKSPLSLEPLQVNGNGTPLNELGEEVTEELLGITDQNVHGEQNLPSLQNMSYTASHFIMVTSDKDYSIAYTLNGTDFKDDCIPDFCADCIYDLEISLTDDCGNYVIGNAQGNGPMTIRVPGSVINDECDLEQTYSYDTLVPLKIGVYNLVKKLTVAPDAMETYLDMIMARDTCLKEMSDFYDAPDITDCFIDCEGCLDSLGTLQEFLDENGADFSSEAAAEAAYNNLKEQCESLCGESYKDECSLGYEMMLQDMSMMGQYGEFDGGSAHLFVVSIFNENNELPVRAREQFMHPFTGTAQPGNTVFNDILSGGTKGSWKTPRWFDPIANTWKVGYYDDDGVRVHIVVSNDGNGNFTPQPQAGVTPMYNTLTQEWSVYPEELANLADFLGTWRNSYAKSLIVFHPEYFKYEFCSNAFTYTDDINNGSGTDVELNTYEYARMLERYPATLAVSELGLSGTMTPLAVINAMLAQDPFFSDATSFANQNLMPAGPPITAKDIFFYKLMSYQPVSGIPANIVQVANANVNCGPGLPLPCPLISSINFSTDLNADPIWRRTAILYATARQEAMGIAMDVFQTTKRFGVHTDCIGNTEYSLPPDLQSTLQYFAGNTVNPCGFPDMFFYAHKDQRFPTFSSMMAEAGFSDPPNPEEFEEYAAQAGLILTDKCPMQIDFENLLGMLAMNGKLLGNGSVVLSTGPYLGSTLYEYIESSPGSNFAANIAYTAGTNDITITIANGCVTTLSWPAGAPSYLDWSDVYMLADVHSGPGGPSLYAYIANSPETHIEIPFTTCLNLSGCTASGRGICKTTQDLRDLKSLMNALSANNELWTPPADLSAYGMFITANLRTVLGNESNAASYTWTYNAGPPATFVLTNTVNSAQITLTLDAGTSTLAIPPATAHIFPAVYAVPAVTGTPSLQSGFSFGAVEQTGNSEFYIAPGTTYEKLNGTISTGNTLRPVYASECDLIPDPRCNTQAHKNLEDLYSKLAKGFQTGVIDMAFLPFADCILPNATFTDGTPVDGSDPQGVISLDADMSQSENGEDTYYAIAVLDLGGGVHKTLKLRSCMPLKNCEPCVQTDNCDVMWVDLDFGPIIEFADTSTYDIPYGDYFMSFGGQTGSSCYEIYDNVRFTYDASYATFQDFLAALAVDMNTAYAPMTVSAVLQGDVIHIEFSASEALPGCDCDANYLAVYQYTEGRTPRIALNILNCCDTTTTTPPASRMLGEGREKTNNGGLEPGGPEGIVVVPAEDNWSSPSVFSYDVDCNEPVVPFPRDTVDDPCVKYLLDLAAETAYNNYQAYLDSVRNAYRLAYRTRCMSALETLQATYENDEYHFTLYYYDRAGNLVRTVPPRAVQRMDLADMAAVNSARNAGTELKPAHNDAGLQVSDLALYQKTYALSSRYIYDALNHPVYQQTPDGGVSTFYYDNLGRLAISQNAKQANEEFVYSYTKYDAQSRITEVGEMRRIDWLSPSHTYLHDPDNSAYYLNNGYTKGQFTRTYYDATAYVPLSVMYPAGFFSQENLRKRVVCTTYESGDGYAENDETFSTATHYDYDYHGNVRSLLNDYTYMPDSDPSDLTYNFRYHKVDYVYDLVSGKVREVALNRNRQDKFIHRYTYDDQNRLLEAKTSKDGYWFDTDASYAYFYHGPLARTEYGPYKSQGADYSYTIHGWLKGINSDHLYAKKDPGLDGQPGEPTQFVARDAYGMSLTYYENDYTAINGTHVDFQLAVPAAYYSNRNLYNGNIVAMNNVQKQTSDPDLSEPLLQVFEYDQLNRIKGSHSYIQKDHFSAITAWNPAAPETDMFRTRYWYDHDGNISVLHRFDKQEVNFDRFEYHYTDGTNQLLDVYDNIAAAVVDYDLPEQMPNNYEYDLIGNLLRDDAEEIAEIRWNIYGKVTYVERTSASAKPDLEFLYDAAGKRIAKRVIPKDGGTYTEHYVLDAQGNILGIYRTNKKLTKLDLTENIMYGSSRLGTWTRNERIYFEVQPEAVQTLERGAKQYELSDHLNNVHATVSDRKKLICDEDMAQYYEPEILNTYDYYPFGMLMEERKQYRLDCEQFSDTTYTEVFNDQFSAATTDWFYVDNFSNPSVTSGQMRLTKPNVSLVRLFTAVPGKQYRMRFRVTLPSCISSVMVMGNVQDISTMVCTASQAYEFVFTANDVNCGVGFIADLPGKGCVIDIDYVILEEINITDTLICDPDSLAAYRFGFNGQMKDNEVAGLDGTSYTAEFWQYDPRIGRRWNIDPIVKPWRSPYDAFNNNPMVRTDPSGDDDYFNSKGEYLGSDGSSTNNIRIISTNTIPKNFYLANRDVEGNKVVNQNIGLKNSALLTDITFNNQEDIQALAFGMRYYAKMAGVDVSKLHNGSFSVSNMVYMGQGYSNDNKLNYNDGIGQDMSASAVALSSFATQNITFPLVEGKLDVFYHDKFNVISLIVHEAAHLRIEGGGRLPHLQVYYEQVKHWSWKKTTQEFKDQMIENIKKDYNGLKDYNNSDYTHSQNQSIRSEATRVLRKIERRIGQKISE